MYPAIVLQNVANHWAIPLFWAF